MPRSIMSLNGLRFLVTGASGFIGACLSLALAASGAEVLAHGLVESPWEQRRRGKVSSPNIDWDSRSLLEPRHCAELVADRDYVIHLAAVQHEMHVPRQRFFDVNVGVTRNLLEASRAAGVRRFVYGSTIGVYGDGGRTALDESSGVDPRNDYAESKLAAEAVVRAEAGPMPTSIARISETYGPGDQRLLKLFRAVQARRFVMIGGGDNLKQPVYVDDVARGLVTMSQHPAPAGNTWILAGAEVVTTRQLVGLIAAAEEVPMPGWRVPMAPVSVAAWAMEHALRPLGIQPPLHTRRLDFFRKSFVFSGARAERELGFLATTSLREGIGRTLDWYRAEGLLPAPSAPDLQLHG